MSALVRMLERHTLPPVARARQSFDRTRLEDPAGRLRRLLDERALDIRPGQRIAITAGSRGIDGCPMPPVILGFVLGPIIERNLIRGRMYSKNDFTALFRAPISGVFLVAAILVCLGMGVNQYRKRNR